MSIIASLCGCISVVKKINGLSFDEWINETLLINMELLMDKKE